MVMLDPVFRDYTGLDFLLLFVAVVVMPVLSALAGRQLARRTPEERRLVPRYWRIVLRGWLIVALTLAVWHVLGRPLSELGLTPRLGTWDYAGFAAVVAAFAVLAVQLLRLKSLSPERLKKAMKSIHGIKITPDTRGELALFMLVSLTAGVWEELLYRGFLIWFLAPLVSLSGAVILSSLVFGLGHVYQGLRGVFVTASIGLALAGLYVLSGTLWWLMAAHALIDIYGGFVTFRVKRLAKTQDLAPVS